MQITQPAAALPAPFGAHALSTEVVNRLWIRREPPVWGFVWRGLLPLLGLVALGWFVQQPFARDDIESTVRRAVAERLRASGNGWVRSNVSGQQVVLRGIPPSAPAGEAAIAEARAAQCPTWAGERTCAVAVTAMFNAPPRAFAPLPAPPALLLPAAAPPAAHSGAACEARWQLLMADAGIEFETGSASLHRRSGPLLDRLATALKACPGAARVEGHTDSMGVAAANQRLSQSRAQAVVDALRARGVAAEKLSALGLGASQPLADNTRPEDRARNRRTEFKAQP
jgi:outer membrane protein OmpA-like peptidoglycan-associated protein